ncbi:hypothetical protein COOONC_16593, partial [Cooperia oncophora]
LTAADRAAQFSNSFRSGRVTNVHAVPYESKGAFDRENSERETYIKQRSGFRLRRPRSAGSTSVEFVGDEFLSDPCAIGHVCNPVEGGDDKAKRIGYEKVQEIKSDPLYAGRVPRQVYEEMLQRRARNMTRTSSRPSMDGDLNSLKGRAVTLEHIPDDLAMLSNGRTFLQEQGPELHVCTASGVCDGGVEVPLLYAMTAHKTEDVYLKDGHLKDLFERLRPRPVERLGTVLDFEKAPAPSPKRKLLGRIPMVTEWWDTIKGVVFLPRRLYPEVRALWNPPVAADHVAYAECKEFLEYLHRYKTWFRPASYKICGTNGRLLIRTCTNTQSRLTRHILEKTHPALPRLREKLNYKISKLSVPCGGSERFGGIYAREDDAAEIEIICR